MSAYKSKQTDLDVKQTESIQLNTQHPCYDLSIANHYDGKQTSTDTNIKVFL